MSWGIPRMNSIQDSLIHLSTAMESTAEIADNLKKWDDTQFTIEKSAYESMNASDQVLNLSKEGSHLVTKLLACCEILINSPGEEACTNTKAALEELVTAFSRITEVSETINEVAHTIEKNVADQKEIEENIKSSIQNVDKKLSEVVANTELYLALKDFIF